MAHYEAAVAQEKKLGEDLRSQIDSITGNLAASQVANRNLETAIKDGEA